MRLWSGWGRYENMGDAEHGTSIYHSIPSLLLYSVSIHTYLNQYIYIYGKRMLLHIFTSFLTAVRAGLCFLRASFRINVFTLGCCTPCGVDLVPLLGAFAR